MTLSRKGTSHKTYKIVRNFDIFDFYFVFVFCIRSTEIKQYHFRQYVINEGEIRRL